jgi:aldose 1-epimerase
VSSVTSTLELVAGRARVVVVPAVGGSLASFTRDGREVLKSAALLDGNVLGMACYPLVPYSNRIAHGRLAFDGEAHVLAHGLPGVPHAIHGVGWQRPWQVAGAEASRARLVLEHAGGGEAARRWPWPFRAEQELALEVDGDGVALVASLSVENTGGSRFPCGLGWHPFFPRDPSSTLSFVAEGMWDNDESGLPLRCVRPEPWGFDRTRTLAGVALDNVFSGWSGSAQLASPARELTVVLAASAPCRHLVVYTPGDGRSVAIEPVSHLTDAFNRAAQGEADTGMQVLVPGARMSATLRIEAVPAR